MAQAKIILIWLTIADLIVAALYLMQGQISGGIVALIAILLVWYFT